jgi:quinol monooxygenase YgiN
MHVYSVWEFHYPAENVERGLAVAEAIWADMPGYDGYLSHEIVRDLDDPGHLMVISRWSSRERADAVLVEYAGHPNAREADRLVDRPRRRFVGELPVPGVA